MPVAVTRDHRDLADVVTTFVRRRVSAEGTRAELDALGAGRRPASWAELLQQGLHSVHLPEKAGGAGAGLAELAVVAEELGRALCPGPFLPTVSASAVLAGADTTGDDGSGDRVATLLAAFAAGDTGALCRDDALVARPEGAGWVVEGRSAPVLGLPGADHVVVAASVAGEPDRVLWFALGDAPGAEITALDPTDLTRSVGTLTLSGHRVSAVDLLGPVPTAWAELAVTTLAAAEAGGLARWCLDTAVEHARVRTQFGRPIGAFQAVQHKAALMLVRAETASAAAWDAARAAGHDAAQQRLAAANALLTALPAGVDNAVECVSLLGAVGFTWEHDVHLYWRRAVSLACAHGAEDSWAARLGERALTTGRDFSFVDSDALPRERARMAAVLDEVVAMPDDAVPRSGWSPPRGGGRQARLAEEGLVAPHYPAPYGLDAGPREQAVLAQEFAARGLAQPSLVVGEWVLPTLLVHGSEQQRERFLGPTLCGRILWCQLFSEPGAGSDLAGLATRAHRVDGGWTLSGQKVWTSMAHEADWGVCLARTDPDARKHQGISYFLVDMSAPGVEVRPLYQATGRAEFNEVFLNEVFVPDDCLVGEPGQGWRLAVTTLANERFSMGATTLEHGSSERFRRLLTDGTYAGSREDAVRGLGRCVSRELALSALNLRGVLARMAESEEGAQVSVRKVYSALAQREGSRDLIRLLGPAASAVSAPAHGDSAIEDPVLDHLGLPAVLFGGGTVEIQLNVLAQRVLGLPRS